MNSCFVWIDAHRAWSALLFLAFVIATSLWVTHRRMIMKHLQEFVETIDFALLSHDEYNVANVVVGKRYTVMIANEEASFLVRSINERLAVFEILFSPTDLIETQGRMPHGWVFRVAKSSRRKPAIYNSALMAGHMMEKHFSAKNRGLAHA